MPLATRDGRPILRVNGIQTQSETYVSLLDEVDALREMAVTHFRFTPQDVDMVAVPRIFRDVLNGVATPAEAEAKLNAAFRTTRLSNGFFHGEDCYRRIRAPGPRIPS